MVFPPHQRRPQSCTYGNPALTAISGCAVNTSAAVPVRPNGSPQAWDDIQRSDRFVTPPNDLPRQRQNRPASLPEPFGQPPADSPLSSPAPVRSPFGSKNRPHGTQLRDHHAAGSRRLSNHFAFLSTMESCVTIAALRSADPVAAHAQQVLPQVAGR